MATSKRAGPGIKDSSVAESAGIRPFKLDASYSGPAAFLAAKGAKYNSSSAEAGDWFVLSRSGGVCSYSPSLTALTTTATWVGGKNACIIGSECAPVAHLDGGAGALATGANTTVSNIYLGRDYPPMVVYNTGANTTNEVPEVTVDANSCDGLALPSTNGDNVGGTITFGASMPNLAATPQCQTNFTVGTDPAFFCEMKLGIPDISDYDVFFFGFVEPAAAYVAAIDTPAEVKSAYDEKAGFSLADAAGDIDIDTSLANTDVNTDTTTVDWVDDAVKTLRVDVAADGATTYRLWAAGTEDTSTGAVAFSFAAATVLTPVIIFAKGAAVADTPPIINYIKWGYS